MKKVFVILFILTGFALLLHSCQEEIMNESDHVESENELSSVEQRFLGLTQLKSGFETTGELFITEVCTDLEKQNRKNRFVHKFVEKYGFPDWDLVQWFDVNNESVVQVPLYKENDNETGAIILVVKNNDKLKFKLLLRDNFAQFVKNRKPVPDVEKIRDLFIIFDFLKFGKSSYLPAGQLTFCSDDSSTAILKSGDLVENTYCYYMEYRLENIGVVSGRWECESWWVYSPITEEQAGDQSSGGDGGYSDWYYETPDGGGGGGESTVSSPEVIIDPTFENTKADCVYNKLVISSMMKNLLHDFVGSSQYHVTYKVVPSITGYIEQPYGRIVDNLDGTMTISINAFYFDKVTPVFLAKTILHETLHAYIYQEVAALGGYPNLENSTFENLYAYYQKYGRNDYQHDYISQYYIPQMASTLRAYDGNKYTLDYYTAISWSGLHDTWGWQAMTQAQRDAIIAKTNY